MKTLTVLVAFVTICAGSKTPSIPADNSHYIAGQSRYIWMPDGAGVPQLVDLQEPVDEALLSTRDGEDNQYWLYTRQNPLEKQILRINNILSVWGSNYRPDRGTIVIVHGWNSDGDSDLNIAITSAFLEVQDVNVIVVDWSGLANGGYITAVVGVPDIGVAVGDFLIWLFNSTGSDWNQLHLVGFSLGAHVVGNAGRRVGGRASRVTGLDPAGPLWVLNDNVLGTDAGRYVEVIHTSAGTLGILDPIGHADFYPNGGQHPQPGCLLDVTCSHGRAHELFASSVRYPYNTNLVANQCYSFLNALLNICGGDEFGMGNGDIDKTGSGIYGLTTSNVWPF